MFPKPSRNAGVIRVRMRSRIVPIALIVLIAGAAALSTGGTLAAASARGQAAKQPFTQVGRYRLQSHPWVNLHQRLMYEARFDDAPPLPLSEPDIETWKKAVDDYRVFIAKRNPILDRELIALNDTLSVTTSRDLPGKVPGIPEAAAKPLASVMPIYRAAQWEADDRANRFWIAVAEPLLASAGDELAEAHSKAYGTAFPKHILVDVTSCAWEFGSYTVGDGDSAHAVIASIVPGNQGFASLEMLMHEPSHAIVDSDSGAVGSDITRAAAELSVKPPYNLWHAILFYTSGELTRRALASRGVSDYHMIVKDMYARGFRGFQQALETHWQAYLDGRLSREEAIRRIVSETAAPRT